MGKVIQPGVWEKENHGKTKSGLKELNLIRHLIRERSDLSSNAKLIALVLADHRRTSDGLCCPCRETIARECGFSARTFSRAFKELESGKVVFRVKGTGVKGITSRYVFDFDREELNWILQDNEVHWRDAWRVPKKTRTPRPKH